jgi:hypothetical protein
MLEMLSSKPFEHGIKQLVNRTQNPCPAPSRLIMAGRDRDSRPLLPRPYSLRTLLDSDFIKGSYEINENSRTGQPTPNGFHKSSRSLNLDTNPPPRIRTAIAIVASTVSTSEDTLFIQRSKEVERVSRSHTI